MAEASFTVLSVVSTPPSTNVTDDAFATTAMLPAISPGGLAARSTVSVTPSPAIAVTFMYSPLSLLMYSF
jgi:hypothetical protein